MKLEIDERHLEQILEEAFERGFYGTLDLKEEVIADLKEEIQKLSVKDMGPEFMRELQGVWLQKTVDEDVFKNTSWTVVSSAATAV